MIEAQIRAPVEDLVLFAAQDLTEKAYEGFVNGQLTQAQLKEFYDILNAWTAASENILAEMHRLGIHT